MSTYQALVNGTPAADDFYDMIAELDVEENADLPGRARAHAARLPTPTAT